MRAVRRLFVALMGLVYLTAYASLWSQVEGLIGSAGILPAGDLLERVREALGSEGWLRFPSVFWWNASDAAPARHRTLIA